jgi:hypothetical protein
VDYIVPPFKTTTTNQQKKIGVLPEEVKKTLIFYIKIVLNSLRSNFYSENQRRKNGNN